MIVPLTMHVVYALSRVLYRSPRDGYLSDRPACWRLQPGSCWPPSARQDDVLGQDTILRPFEPSMMTGATQLLVAALADNGSSTAPATRR
jgi:hypothetical protein